MRIWVIDAFTDRPFAGNPAGVCLLDTTTWPDRAWMRQLAAELHLETAFAHPLPADADWALRWFTPTAESNLCGHATLATAHALHHDRGTPGTVRFASRFGVLIAHTRHDGAITLDFPAAPPPRHRPPTAWPKRSAPADEATIRAITPYLAALAHLTRRDGIRGIIATAPADDPDRGYDFVSRYFAPAGGIPEDPVTGSAHTALAPYWSHRLGRDRLTGLQASARTGLVHTAVRGDRVHLTGHAVTILDGALHHPAG